MSTRSLSWAIKFYEYLIIFFLLRSNLYCISAVLTRTLLYCRMGPSHSKKQRDESKSSRTRVHHRSSVNARRRGQRLIIDTSRTNHNKPPQICGDRTGLHHRRMEVEWPSFLLRRDNASSTNILTFTRGHNSDRKTSQSQQPSPSTNSSGNSDTCTISSANDKYSIPDPSQYHETALGANDDEEGIAKEGRSHLPTSMTIL